MTTKGLDSLETAMLAISDQGVDVSVCDPRVRALLIGTGVALGIHPDGGLPAGFSLLAKVAQDQELALHPTREWRRDDRGGNRLGCVA